MTLYAYSADLWCESCAEEIIRNLTELGHADEGDSDAWPQQVPEGETDAPSHCAGASKCLEAIDLGAYGLEPDAELFGAEARTVGALLDEQLTEQGYRYAYELVTEQDPTPYQRALHKVWRKAFPELVTRIEGSARTAGIADGRNAASWLIDGNTTEQAARRLLDGIEAGDPEILDEIPSTPLSGEHADGLLPRDVLGWYGLLEDDWNADGVSGIAAEVLNAYEDGWSEGMVDEVERSARAILPTEGEES